MKLFTGLGSPGFGGDGAAGEEVGALLVVHLVVRAGVRVGDIGDEVVRVAAAHDVIIADL